MRSNGKKLFPDKNRSDIFFINNNIKTNVNPNKYVNINNPPINNKTSYVSRNGQNINNKTNLKNDLLSGGALVGKRRLKRHRTLEILNSNNLKNKNYTINYDNNNNNNNNNNKQFNRKKVLYTQKSVDFLRPKRKLGAFSTSEYILNKSNIWNGESKSKTNLNSLNNSIEYKPEEFKKMNNEEYKPLNTISNFSNFSIDKITNNNYNNVGKIKKKKQKDPLDSYYNKFVNKKFHKKKCNNKNKKSPPKEKTFIIKKVKQDDSLIDTYDLKKNFSKNGINIISMSGLSNSLVPVNEDAVKIRLSSNDINSKKFKKIEQLIKDKGLKLDEIKQNFNIKFTEGIFPENMKWNDLTYGGREKFEVAKIREKFDKKRKVNAFSRKQLISKNCYINNKYKNNMEIKPRRYKSAEKTKK
jgi:hypothetical protein